MMLRAWIGVWVLAIGMAPCCAQEPDAAADKAAAAIPEVYIPLAGDLDATGEQARTQGVPILLMFAAENCVYCQYIDRNFLEPMIISGRYDDKVLIRKVYIDSEETLRDFSGAPVTGAELAARYGVKLTPIVVFLGPEGEELAERMIGISSPDYYGAYLDEHIATALQQMSAAGRARLGRRAGTG